MASTDDTVKAILLNVEKSAVPLVAMLRSMELPNEDSSGRAGFPDAPVFISTFYRFIEIACNVYFRAKELLDFGEISKTQISCLERMKIKGVIREPELWFEMVKDCEIAFKQTDKDEMILACRRMHALYSKEIAWFLENSGLRF